MKTNFKQVNIGEEIGSDWKKIPINRPLKMQFKSLGLNAPTISINLDKLLLHEIVNTAQLDFVFTKIHIILFEIEYLTQEVEIIIMTTDLLKKTTNLHIAIYNNRFNIEPVSGKTLQKLYYQSILSNFPFIYRVCLMILKLKRKIFSYL